MQSANTAVMGDHLTATPLTGRQVQRAYALVSLMHPHVTAKQWTGYARNYARVPRQRGGLIGLSDRRGYVHAIFFYAVDRASLEGCRLLRLSQLSLAQLPGRSLVAGLTSSAEHLAAEFACEAISIEVPTTTLTASTRVTAQITLESTGFRPAGIKMVRRPMNAVVPAAEQGEGQRHGSGDVPWFR